MFGSNPRTQEQTPGQPDGGAQSAPSIRKFCAYTTFVILVPVLFLALALPIVRSDTFLADSADPFLLNLEYAFQLKNANCGILIFGDSTALTGIDPLTIEGVTGLKTCNIAQTQSIIAIDGTLSLDAYLRNNSPPRFLILQFAPETLARVQKFFWPEGMTLLLRKGSALDALATSARHPVESYNFAVWAIKAFVRARTNPYPSFRTTQEIFNSHRGLVILPKPPQTACVRNLAYSPPSPQWVRALREKYAVAGTQVLIDISPIPECTTDRDKISAGIAGLTDNVLPVLPVGLFCDLDRHLTLLGAQQVSLDIARQILGSAPAQHSTGDH
jgi:hypothetical protein